MQEEQTMNKKLTFALGILNVIFVVFLGVALMREALNDWASSSEMERVVTASVYSGVWLLVVLCGLGLWHGVRK